MIMSLILSCHVVVWLMGCVVFHTVPVLSRAHLILKRPVRGGLESCVSIGREIVMGDMVESLWTVILFVEAMLNDLCT